MKTLTFTCGLAGLLISSVSHSTDTVQWGYTGESGPQNWGKLSPEFEICSSGKNQSPIDLTAMVEGDLSKLNINYKSGGRRVVNNGHSIKIEFGHGSNMLAEGHSFNLKQVHFHSPSENTLEGQSYPMEAHFVHADDAGNLAVIALFYEYGDKDQELQKAWSAMPDEAGKLFQLYDHIDPNKLLPSNHDHYRFNGSLTTPPCTEGVKWFVFKQTATASKEQIEKFSKIMGHANNRPVQPVNARIVIK